MTTRPIYQQLAISVDAMKRCSERGNDEWYTKHRNTIETIVNNHMPRGSGIDNGTSLDFDRSNGERIRVRYVFSSYERVGHV